VTGGLQRRIAAVDLRADLRAHPRSLEKRTIGVR
jgi:hypothetical protein